MMTGRNIQRSKGFALIAVLWLVAALSIMVTGLMKTVKSEVKTATIIRQTIQAKASGEAAMQLALQQVVGGGARPNKLETGPVSFDGQEIQVQMMPMNGFIDLNRAPLELLQALFQVGAGMDAARAGNIVAVIENARRVPGPSGKPPGFESPEDLLQVPGMDYPSYARIAPLVTTDAGGTGRVNVQAAPPDVLNIIAGGNQAAVASFLQARGGDNVGADTSQMNAAWIDNGGSAGRSVELRARVPLADGGAVLITRRYTITPRSADGLPWRVFYASSQVELASSPKL